MKPRARIAGAVRVVPHALTLAGGGASIVGAAWLAARPELGASLLLLGWLCDIADGWLARRLGVASDFGAQLDWAVDTAVVHVMLALFGHLWAVLPLALLQARSLVLEERSQRSAAGIVANVYVCRRISGRTLLVCAVVLQVFGGPR